MITLQSVRAAICTAVKEIIASKVIAFCFYSTYVLNF